MADLSKKYPSINYTSRDFNSIRSELINYAIRYYPETVKDFSQASFAAMMLDSVAYVGDMLAFYQDYQFNESLLVSANDYDNVIRLSKQIGYKFKGSPSAFGRVAFYAIIPANSLGLGPNSDYLPILKANSVVASTTGASFIVTEDVRFDNPKNEVVVARINQSTGAPSSYAVRAYANVVSGRFNTIQVEVGAFQKYRRISIQDPAIVEIISVSDSQGNQYFEVDYLSQDVIYKSEMNTDPLTKEQSPSLLIPTSAPRRYAIERTTRSVDLMFGNGSESDYASKIIGDPSNVLMERFGRNYVTDELYDPANLISNEQLGIAPADTTLTITYRANDLLDVNAPADTVTSISAPIVDFVNPINVPSATRISIINSMECTNEEPIFTTKFNPDIEDIKMQAMDTFASQGRAVTAQDYESAVYHMPGKFGSVTRARAVKDNDSLKRNINLYILSTNTANQFALCNSATKQNVKNWINKYRMINDTIDIMDARIVNIGIEFDIYIAEPHNKYVVLENCLAKLREKYRKKMFIGEPLNIFDIYTILNKVDGVADVSNVTINNKSGTQYSGDFLNLKRYMTSDGRRIIPPENVVFEVKYVLDDIVGTVR